MRHTLLLLIILLFAACGNKKAERRAEQIKEEMLSIPAEMYVVAAVGRIEPEAGLVAIATEYGGTVLKILKNTGDAVKQGDVILQLQADYAMQSAKNAYLNAAYDYVMALLQIELTAKK